jgi:F-type H+-transporting ATPase subunit alpha
MAPLQISVLHLIQLLIEKKIFIYGVIISTGCAVVTLEGFLIAFIGEVFRICVMGFNYLLSKSFGLVVNLYLEDTMNLLIGALLLNPSNGVCEGQKVNGIYRLASIILGDFAIGSILDPVGSYILNAMQRSVTRSSDSSYWLVLNSAPGIILRQSVFEPIQTGIISIDSMIPIGRGQRELIVGDRQTGKTSIGVDTILNQKYKKVFCIYVPIGQKASSILEVFLAFVRKDAIFYLSMVCAPASSSAVHQFLCAYTGNALSEFFVYTKTLAVFLMVDGLSKHAMAYREIYLLLRRPPGREAYPGEIFFVHSRLLERSAKLNDSLGGGSLSVFPVIETLASDVSAYISTNVISITDGQIFLSQDLFVAGIKPAIDVALSVTRVGSIAQWDRINNVASNYKLELAQFIELQSFSQFITDLGKETLDRLRKGLRLVEILKQFSGSPINLIGQIGILSLANENLIKGLAINSVQVFLHLYFDVPVSVLLFVPARLVGTSLVEQLNYMRPID